MLLNPRRERSVNAADAKFFAVTAKTDVPGKSRHPAIFRRPANPIRRNFPSNAKKISLRR
ncbi:hypothetical protein [uncultured Mailhella sp.]|uniref:hypothetical protein n=1 Tax=uncultured Mailhella sp. TaxID=1981031 RepID=UPI003209A6C7